MKKLLPYIFIPLVFIGLFSPIMSIQAQTPPPLPACKYDAKNPVLALNPPCKDASGKTNSGTYQDAVGVPPGNFFEWAVSKIVGWIRSDTYSYVCELGDNNPNHARYEV